MEAIAKHKFAATAPDELSFEKDDILKIINKEEDENWFKAELNQRSGFVPSNYITMKPNPWYVAKISREESEKKLLVKSGGNHMQPDGAFLVRPSETSPGDFSISVKFGESVQHYKILRDREGKFFLWVVKFNSINELIEYHRQASVSRTQTVVLKEMIDEQQARVARALYDFEPGNADEIRFKKGDMVEVIGEEDCNWWKGRCHGQEGIFPAAYVKIS